MIKRLAVVAFLTGLGHLVNILILKYLSNNISFEAISIIGEIDSLVILTISMIAFGLQLSTTRRLATMDDWKTEYYDSQSARLALSVFLTLLGLTGFLITKNFLFLFAPVFALNADFALYGRGMPKLGALLALIRILIPAFCLLFFSIYFIDYLIIAYAVSIIAAYFIVGLLVSKALKVAYFVKPKLNNLKKYIEHIDIGISTILFSFIGLGLVYVVSYFYSNETVAVIYLILKLYMIFKGVRQIIVQSFIMELLKEKVALKVDFIAVVAGFVLFISLGFYTEITVPLFFSEAYLTYYKSFLFIALAGLISSMTTSSGVILLLRNKDYVYSKIIIIAGVATISSSIAFYYLFGDAPYWIAISVLIGETILTGLYFFELKDKNFMSELLKLIYPLLAVALVIIIFGYFTEVNLILYTVLMISFCAFALVYSKRKINLF